MFKKSGKKMLKSFILLRLTKQQWKFPTSSCLDGLQTSHGNFQLHFSKWEKHMEISNVVLGKLSYHLITYTLLNILIMSDETNLALVLTKIRITTQIFATVLQVKNGHSIIPWNTWQCKKVPESLFLLPSRTKYTFLQTTYF